MYLVRLIYTSTISKGFSSADVQSIIETARIKNTANNVTGLLCFSRNIFLQCLEGSRDKVNKTYHRILNDKRHEGIIMLDYQEIIERDFSDWSMGYVPESSLTKHLNLKYSGTDNFDPFNMSGESSHHLMIALKQTVPTKSS